MGPTSAFTVVRSFVRSFGRSFVWSFVCLFGRLFGRSSFVRSGHSSVLRSPSWSPSLPPSLPPSLCVCCCYSLARSFSCPFFCCRLVCRCVIWLLRIAYCALRCRCCTSSTSTGLPWGRLSLLAGSVNWLFGRCTVAWKRETSQCRSRNSVPDKEEVEASVCTPWCERVLLSKRSRIGTEKLSCVSFRCDFFVDCATVYIQCCESGSSP